MIEILVMTICVRTTPLACENAASAYYSQSDAKQVLNYHEQRLSRKHPLASMFIAQAAFIAQGKAVIGLGGEKSLTLDIKSNTIGYKVGF